MTNQLFYNTDRGQYIETDSPPLCNTITATLFES